jgi:hypothetical protein
MKIQFIFSYFIIALLSCHKNNDNIIVGEWSNCQTTTFQNNGEETTISYNVCPIIVFVNDHSGYIKRGSIQAAPFTWEINEGKLIIKHTENNRADILDSGAYQIIPDTKKSYHEINLLNSIKKVKYSLGK